MFPARRGSKKFAPLTVLLLATALIAAPGYTPFSFDDHDGAAYAKAGGSGKGGGKGGGKANGKQGSSKSSASKKPAKNTTPAVTTTVAVETEVETSLHPSQKGKWNAANANQKALDAHIKNQNFNGTIGALSQFQLAAKAAAGEELSEIEQAALDHLIGGEAATVSDADLADYLNADAIEGDPVFSVSDGVVSCSANCDGVDMTQAQLDADAEATRLQDEIQQAAYDDLLTDSEQRIVDESNRSLSPDLTEDLLDELAGQLGVTRSAVITDPDLVPEEVIE
jgi:hypothetical protein